MSRLVLVSNRLPVTVRVEGSRACLDQSPGGLATGLSRHHETAGTIWVGWPGETERLRDSQREPIDSWLAEHRMIPVRLTAQEVAAYYEGYANGVLWPLFHYLPGRVPLHVNDWDAYEAANQRFADAVAAQVQPGDVVWVHDYQLLRLPALLRERVPDVKIGFFLHIPFPSSEIFGTIPQRDLLLQGMLGADLIGFHTASYKRHFSTALVRVLGVQPELDRVDWQGRDVRVGVFPMGVDAKAFAAHAATPAIAERATALRGADRIKLLVGVDRLDYTKGIRRRLLAFERLLEDHPELHGRVRLVQVGVPSREQVGEYRTFRKQVDEAIGRINGTFGTPDWTPINWIYRALPMEELVALYCAADVMLVTPLRDGMNLVAKEFVASRLNEDGVLVLSEFAGAAVELAEAVQVNPFDIDGAAETYYRALTMPEEEQRLRMHGLRRRVFAADVEHWIHRFLGALESGDRARERQAALVAPATLAHRVLEARGDRHLLLLLDYDGTLVPFASAPHLARPAPELIAVLRALASEPGVTAHVVSGRTRETLERWLGRLGIALHAEHGVWSRSPGASEWVGVPVKPRAWYERVRAILEEYATNTPGALVEEKALGLAWHYRGADPEFGAWQARELQLTLTELLANAPVEVHAGNRVIEVRPHGLGKGLAVTAALAAAPAGTLVVAVGDGRTDEDMFAALPADGIAVHVGSGTTRAHVLLAGVPEVRTFLLLLAAALDGRGEHVTPRRRVLSAVSPRSNAAAPLRAGPTR